MSIISDIVHLGLYNASQKLSEDKMTDNTPVDSSGLPIEPNNPVTDSPNEPIVPTNDVQGVTVNVDIPHQNETVSVTVPATEPPKEQALRYNQGKLEYSMLDLTKLQECVKVLMFGKQKYARDNWKKGMNTSSIIDSLMRHLSAIQNGEVIDPESGLSHLGHLQCNILFLGNPNNTQDVQVLPPDKPLQ